MQTYFISNGAHVKIGRTYKAVEKRLAALQTASPSQLVVMLILEGDREKEFHTRFAEARVTGEWFSLTHPALREFVGAPSSFYLYLLKQVERNDWVGHFAHDAKDDACFPRHSTDYKTLKGHLTWSHTSCRAAHVGLVRAFREWTQLGRKAVTR